MNLASYVVNKLSEAVTDPYAVKEYAANKLKESDLVHSKDLLFLYELDGFYDLYLVNPNAPQTKIRIFHISTSKKKEALDLYERFGNKLLVLCQSSPKCFVLATLQIICTLIRTRSSWSPAHVAVEAGLKEVFWANSPLSKWVNSQSCELHYTPLHIACQLNDVILCQALLQAGADLNKQDDKGNTVVHLAVLIGADKVFSTLCEHASKKVLNIENNDGDTPLHIAAKLDKNSTCLTLLANGANPYHCGPIALPLHLALKYKCYKTANVLLTHDPRLVKEKCKKHGGIPLHWCKEKEQIVLLTQYHTPTEVLSRGSHLPLHVMVMRGRLEAAVAIILSHGHINSRGRHGNTALHLAVKYDSVMLVKMLILFGADPRMKNDFEETPGDLALHSSSPNRDEIVELLSSVGCIGIPNSPSMLSETNHSKPKPIEGDKVLCLDGGGIRGLISTQILMEMERLCGRKCKDMFDWISGTSTGGILALALALGKSAVGVQRLYFRLKDKVFNGSRPYSAEPIEEFLKQEFGEDTTMESISRGPKVLVTTSLADRKPMQLHLFKNYEGTEWGSVASDESISKHVSSPRSVSKLKQKVPSLKQPLWKVARCSGAAPTYFRPMDKFLDGGLIANNPTLDTLTELHRFHKCQESDESPKLREKSKKEVGVVVSVGTGCSKLKIAG